MGVGRVFASMESETFKAEDSGWVLAVTEVRSFVSGADLAGLIARIVAKVLDVHAYYSATHFLQQYTKRLGLRCCRLLARFPMLPVLYEGPGTMLCFN